VLSLNTRKASLLKKKKTLELKTPPTERGERKRGKPFGMKNREKSGDCGEVVEDRILHLVAELERVEIKVGELKSELKEMVKVAKSRRSGLRARKKEDNEEKNPEGRKNSWNVGDSVIVMNSFRYRGSSCNHSQMNGTVTKVTKHWIWFSVRRFDPFIKDFFVETGHYRARHSLSNERWGMC